VAGDGPGVVTDVPASSCIADVLQLHDRRGWLSPPLVRVAGGPGAVAGPATTVQLRVGPDGPGLGPLQTVLSGDLAGRVVVLAGAQGVADAVWGEILSLAAAGRGALAAVVDGRARDRTAIEAMAFPVWALGEATAGPYGMAHVTSVGEPVVVAGVEIADGDVVVVDDGGVVALPAASADHVLAAARIYADGEDAVVAALRDGEPLVDAYRHKKAGVERVRALRPERPSEREELGTP
jgi:4-hydroxy-4-methyl-2-oxoglutarate aldolase